MPGLYVLPWIALPLLALCMVGWLGPQHQVKSKDIVICWAPDCRSSVSTSTAVCGGTKRLQRKSNVDALTPGVLMLILILQVLALRLRRRMLSLGAGIACVLGSVVIVGVVAYHAIIGHLLDKTSSLWGEELTVVAALLLGGLGVLQIVFAAASPAKPPERTATAI